MLLLFFIETTNEDAQITNSEQEQEISLKKIENLIDQAIKLTNNKQENDIQNEESQVDTKKDIETLKEDDQKINFSPDTENLNVVSKEESQKLDANEKTNDDNNDLKKLENINEHSSESLKKENVEIESHVKREPMSKHLTESNSLEDKTNVNVTEEAQDKANNLNATEETTVNVTVPNVLSNNSNKSSELDNVKPEKVVEFIIKLGKFKEKIS